jgi:hypothetical protein
MLALLLAQVPAPESSVSPTPQTIIRLKTTPFCTTFRENVFHAVQGLRVNDLVIDQGQSVLGKWAYDSVVDKGRGGGASRKMDQYQLGQVVGQAAHNLQRVYALLNDADRFPSTPQTNADRDLATMKAALEAVADSQERSLNILSGTYETAALNALLSLGDPTTGALRTGGSVDKPVELGDPVFTSPGSIPPPTTASSVRGSLFSGTPVGQIRTAVVITQKITGSVEDHVDAAIVPGVQRCSDNK